MLVSDDDAFLERTPLPFSLGRPNDGRGQWRRDRSCHRHGDIEWDHR